MSHFDSSQNQLPQLAQKCAWCYKYIYEDKTTIYTGDDKKFTNWICHTTCEEIYGKKVMLTTNIAEPS